LIPIGVVEGMLSVSLRKYEAYRVRGLYDDRLW